MACADALWRTWVQPTEARTDPNSFFQHIGILRPQETGKFGSKPGFRRMHDVIQHDIWTSMLDCWEREVKLYNATWVLLTAFAEAKPSWDDIVTISEVIAKKYIGTSKILLKERKKPESQTDQLFENQILRNRDELLYLELSHAMNSGDISRVEATFLHWIYMFKAAGKHKYATQILKFMFNLEFLYSPELMFVNFLGTEIRKTLLTFSQTHHTPKLAVQSYRKGGWLSRCQLDGET
jgi:hypothetical protein